MLNTLDCIKTHFGILLRLTSDLGNVNEMPVGEKILTISVSGVSLVFKYGGMTYSVNTDETVIKLNGNIITGTATQLKTAIDEGFSSSNTITSNDWSFLKDEGVVSINGEQVSGNTVRIFRDVFNNRVSIEISDILYEVNVSYDTVSINGSVFTGTIDDLKTQLIADIFSGFSDPIGASPYTKYIGVFTQSGTDTPTLTTFEDTIGGTMVITRQGPGAYLITQTGAFPLGRTYVHTTCSIQGAGFVVGADPFSANDIAFTVYDETFTNVDLGGFSTGRIFFEIRVYPEA